MTDKIEWRDGKDGVTQYIPYGGVFLIPEAEDMAEEYPFFVEESSSEERRDPEIPILARNVRETNECAKIFAARYNDNKIPLKSRYEEYMGNTTVQNLVRDLELDPDKFWILVLFLCDYCESKFYNGRTMKPAPVDQLNELYDAVTEAGEDAMTLTFKSGKHKAVIDSKVAIKTILDALEDYFPKIKDKQMLKDLYTKEKAAENVMLKESPYIAFFARCMLLFFTTRDAIVSKRKKGAKHSTKEIDLVCQMIYLTRISKSKCWLELQNETLKSYLKQYKDYEYPKNVSSVYPECTIWPASVLEISGEASWIENNSGD